MDKINFTIKGIPAVLYGEESKNVYLFVHGKDGNKEEAEPFARIMCPRGYQVLGIDLPPNDKLDPWHAIPELKQVMDYMKETWDELSIRANSIGAWFCMQSFSDVEFTKCLFVSPILDMHMLIKNMMKWANVSEEELMSAGTIETSFGATLDWKYLTFAKDNPISKWDSPTSILYAENDNMTDRITVDMFVRKFVCKLDVMENGEHWFHTPEQLEVLKKWESRN